MGKRNCVTSRGKIDTSNSVIDLYIQRELSIIEVKRRRKSFRRRIRSQVNVRIQFVRPRQVFVVIENFWEIAIVFFPWCAGVHSHLLGKAEK